MLCSYILALHSSLNRTNSSPTQLELNTRTSQPLYNRVYRVGTVCPTVFCVRQALSLSDTEHTAYTVGHMGHSSESVKAVYDF